MTNNYNWISQIATDARPYAPYLGRYLAKSIIHINLSTVSSEEKRHAFFVLARDLLHFSIEKTQGFPPHPEETLKALQSLSKDELNKYILDENKLAESIASIADFTFKIIADYPGTIEFMNERELIEDMIGTVAGRFLAFFKLIPVFSKEALEVIPYMKEPLFTALYELSEEDLSKLSQFTKLLLDQYYQRKLRPSLVHTLKDSIRGRNLLLPLVDEALAHLPLDRCMTALISMGCTSKDDLTQGKVISIILQELGGMYVKLAQVLSEIAPPSLAKELKQQQDKLGGIFGSEEKSWQYVLEIFNRPLWQKYKDLLIIPQNTQHAFAGASVGAIYEFQLNENGKRLLETESSVLLKVQRPGLKNLFESQKDTLIEILDNLEKTLPQTELNRKEQIEVATLILALKRTIINYASQSIGELDFNVEKKNADEVRSAFKRKFDLQVPRFIQVETDVAMMERIRGEKITSVVKSRYLERVEIADLVTDAYLYLMFKKGIIWADPHAGNLLYDPDKLQVKLIDLNPCFHWNQETVNEFIAFLYQLILCDQKGIFKSLKNLVENPYDLENEKTKILIEEFVKKGNHGAFIRQLSDFVRLLSEANINIRIEVQAALRGLSQIYLTAQAISSRNNFGKVFQNQFHWKVLAKLLLSIGPIKVIKSALPIVFDVVRDTPEEEVGPTLDERDLTGISNSLELLTKESVCNIEMIRTSPEENTNLTLAADGSGLIKSSHLRLEVLTETKPASVRYIIEVPSKEWLKERQEYVKLQGLGHSLCLVECMEQLRRHSLEDYWHVVESWNNSSSHQSVQESSLIGDVKLAARILFSRRFKNIWVSDFMTISNYNRALWKLLIGFEIRFARREQGYLYILSKKADSKVVGHYTFGTIQRVKVIIYRLIISGLKSLIKRSRFEMNLLPLSTEELNHRMLHGLLRRGPQSLEDK